jgi:hypothetical protein
MVGKAVGRHRAEGRGVLSLKLAGLLPALRSAVHGLGVSGSSQVAEERTERGTSTQGRSNRIEPRRAFDGFPIRVTGRRPIPISPHRGQFPCRQEPKEGCHQREKRGGEIKIFFHFPLSPPAAATRAWRARSGPPPCGARFTDLVARPLAPTVFGGCWQRSRRDLVILGN